MEAEKHCRDCGYCTERGENQGKCWAKDVQVSFDDSADSCSWFRASSLRVVAGSDVKPKYGRLKLARTG